MGFKNSAFGVTTCLELGFAMMIMCSFIWKQHFIGRALDEQLLSRTLSTSTLCTTQSIDSKMACALTQFSTVLRRLLTLPNRTSNFID